MYRHHRPDCPCAAARYNLEASTRGQSRSRCGPKPPFMSSCYVSCCRCLGALLRLPLQGQKRHGLLRAFELGVAEHVACRATRQTWPLSMLPPAVVMAISISAAAQRAECGSLAPRSSSPGVSSSCLVLSAILPRSTSFDRTSARMRSPSRKTLSSCSTRSCETCSTRTEAGWHCGFVALWLRHQLEHELQGRTRFSAKRCRDAPATPVVSPATGATARSPG
jgi:hypothetical protein